MLAMLHLPVAWANSIALPECPTTASTIEKGPFRCAVTSAGAAATRCDERVTRARGAQTLETFRQLQHHRGCHEREAEPRT